MHVAALDVSVWRYAFNGADEPAAHILRAGRDIEVRVVERIEKFSAQLQAIPLGQLYVDQPSNKAFVSR